MQPKPCNLIILYDASQCLAGAFFALQYLLSQLPTFIWNWTRGDELWLCSGVGDALCLESRGYHQRVGPAVCFLKGTGFAICMWSRFEDVFLWSDSSLWLHQAQDFGSLMTKFWQLILIRSDAKWQYHQLACKHEAWRQTSAGCESHARRYPLQVTAIERFVQICNKQESSTTLCTFCKKPKRDL